MTPVDFVIAPDAEGAAAAAAGVLVELARRGGHVALAGGSTPRRAYELAAELEPDWSRVDIWLGDERCVSPDDERSNLRLVRETLLARLDRQPTLHPVHTELDAVDAAATYDEALRGVVLELALLGLGDDGHTASLFPGSPALDERDRLAVSADPGLAPWVGRVTMTLPMLLAARQIVFLVVGNAKAESAHRAFVSEPSVQIPASLVRFRKGPTTAILDRAAASSIGRDDSALSSPDA